MEIDAIKAKIEDAIDGAEATVTGDGSHFDAIVVSEAFAGMSPVAKQKMVYAPLNEHITSGELHALTIKAYTPAEWEKAKKLQIGS
ncbi:MAG: BolA family transcriptional regulator [Gammaproteobacteria bacterium]|nr:BolA family transcriptional regulator [Gammaproteobacteria bacterium]